MPWTAEKAHEHKKGMTPHQAEVWAKVANDALRRCQEGGGDNCDAQAIRQANSAVNRMDSADDGIRFDAGEVLGVGRIDPDTGFLHVDAKVTRTGVLTYRFPDGSTRRELRHPREVFDADSLASLKLRPTTNDHPYTEPRCLVTSENAKRLQVGHSGESVAHDSKWVTVPLVVTDGEMIKSIKAGRKQLSCGYQRSLVWNSGIFDGEAYDCEQVMIRYNHIAHVDNARVGPEASILLDAQDAWEDTTDNKIIIRGDDRMQKVTLDGIQYDAAPEVARALDKKEEEIRGLQGQIDAGKAKADGLQAKLDSMTAEIETLKKSSSEDAIQTRVRERASLETQAARYLSKDTKLDGMSDLDIRRAVIKEVNKDLNLDGKSDAYVNAAFDYAITQNPEKKQETMTVAADAKTTPVQSARAKMIQEKQDAWKKVS